MPESPLKDRLNEFLTKAGFLSGSVFLSDRSAASRPVRIVGLGSARKIIFESRLIDQLTPLETEALIAIEIGRTKYCSAVKASVIFMFLSFFFFLFLELAVQQPWFYQGLGVNPSEGIGHGEAFVLYSMAVFVFMFPLIPIKNLFMRSVEENAERFSVKLLDWNSMISAIVKAFADKSQLRPIRCIEFFISLIRTNSAALKRSREWRRGIRVREIPGFRMHNE